MVVYNDIASVAALTARVHRNLKVGVLDDDKGVLPSRGPGENPRGWDVDPKLGV
jgi:hypothetical protein